MAASDAIEAISIKERRENPYERYSRELEEYLEEIQDLEIDEIIMNVSSKDSDLHFGRRIAHVNLRALLQDLLNNQNDQKNSILRETKGIYLVTAGSVCELVGAATPVGQLGSVVGGLFNATNRHFDTDKNARHQMVDHLYNRVRDITGEHSQQQASAERNTQKAEDLTKRIIEIARRQSEMVANN